MSSLHHDESASAGDDHRITEHEDGVQRRAR
jgi:hypothetical protein